MMQRLACLSISDPNHLDGFLEAHGNLVDLADGYGGGGWGLGFWRSGEMLTRKTPIGPKLDARSLIRDSRARQCLVIADCDAKLRSSRTTMQPLRFRDWVFGVTGHHTTTEEFAPRARAALLGFGKTEPTVPGLMMTTMMHALHRANLLDRRPLNPSAYYGPIAEGADRIRQYCGPAASELSVAFVLHIKGLFFLGSLGRPLYAYRVAQHQTRFSKRVTWSGVVVRDEASPTHEEELVTQQGLHVDDMGGVSSFCLN